MTENILNDTMINLLKKLDAQKLAELQKAQSDGITDAFSSINDMPNIAPYGGLSASDEQKLREEIHDYLQRQYGQSPLIKIKGL